MQLLKAFLSGIMAFAAITQSFLFSFSAVDLLHTACSSQLFKWSFNDFMVCGTFGIHPAYMPGFYLCLLLLEYSDAFVWHHDISNGKSACSCLYGQLSPCPDLCSKQCVDLSYYASFAEWAARNQSLCICMPYYASCFYAQFIFVSMTSS